jgi:hypothetical protein
MKKILLIPLDERPCNYDFPEMLTRDTDYQIIMPPREFLGKKKQAGDTDSIWNWLFENISCCDNAIISIDTLLYSGIVPSRLHQFEPEMLTTKLNRLHKLKELNPKLTLYAFNLIMRNPTYSSDEEEPDYYGQWGKEIHLHGFINHKKELGIATDEEILELKEIDERLPKEYLDDYINRRATNIQVNQAVVHLAADGVFDFVIIPQDDSSPYGLTAKDQQVIRELIDSLNVNLKVYMYPDADAVANTLVARTINLLEVRRPLVYVKYASSIGHSVIPTFEDRIVSESIKYQILAAGGLVASSALEAQLILMVNIPGGDLQDHLQEPVNSCVLQRTIQYDAYRNLIELIEYADYAIGTLHKGVIFGDIAYGNGGDPLLLSLLKQKDLIWKLAGYAGWNTSSNSLGTCLPMGMIYDIFGDTKGHRNFLALRYIEDIGYDALVRQEIYNKNSSPCGLDRFKVDGQRGEIAVMVGKMLQHFAAKNLNDNLHQVKITDCYLPWERLFEVGITVDVTCEVNAASR